LLTLKESIRRAETTRGEPQQETANSHAASAYTCSCNNIMSDFQLQ